MRKKRIAQKTTRALVPSRQTAVQRVSVDALALIPEEEVWLASRKSARTRRAYQHDVAHFMGTFGITSPEELRKVDHRAVMLAAFDREVTTIATTLSRPDEFADVLKQRSDVDLWHVTPENRDNLMEKLSQIIRYHF